MDIIKFDPNVEELQKIVAVTSQITAPDLADDAQLAVIHGTRISLRDARVKIEKAGKQYRADALAFQKNVIARERELIAIIEPEEKRLKAFEEEADAIKERAARAALLPLRREQLAQFGDPVPSDETLLDMDNDAFIIYLNERTALKNEQERLRLEQERQALEEERRAIARAAELAKAAEDAKIAERERIAAENRANEERRIQEAAQAKIDAEKAAQKLVDDAKAEAERIAAEARFKIAQEKAQAEAAERERQVREQQAKDEAAKKEAQAKYAEWAKEQGWTPETASEYRTQHTHEGIELWKRVGIYKQVEV